MTMIHYIEKKTLALTNDYQVKLFWTTLARFKYETF